MKKQYLILLYVLLIIAGCYPESIIAQGSYEALVAEGTLRIPRTFKDETQLPSPEAAGMNRFIDHPVSYNTGVVSPSIPLYDIQVGRYSMPVTLNYHGAGIKADDENYYVGLGWSLFVGGYISRTVRGRPDEQQEFNIRSTRTFTLGNKDDLTYLKDVLHRQIDANYDRYNYSFAGYSGSFILRKSVSGMDVVQLPETDLKIELIGEVLEGVRNFKITTPAGEQYSFTEREHTNYHYNPHVLEANPGYRTADYMCVSGWYLSSVVTSSNEDTIRFAYDRYSENRRKSEEYSLYRYFRHFNNQFYEGGNGTPHLRPIHIITYPDKCYLKSITCRSCSLHFKNSVDGTLGKVHLDHISVISVTGKAIRDISFSFTDSNSKGKLLKDLIVKCGDQLLDYRNFEYYPWSGSLHKDLFGYMNSNPHLEGYADDEMKSSINPNSVNDNNIPYSRISIWEGLITTIDTLGRDTAIRGPIDNNDSAPRNTWSEINYSVLDRDGKLGVARRHYFKSAVGLSLKSIKDAKGAVTTFEYESSECDSFRYTVGVGLRIKNITVSDPMTGRTKTRHFEYENPKSTIDFDRLSSSSFISLGGLIRHHGLSSKECSSGATTKYSFTGKPVSVKNLHRTRLVDVKYAYETLTNTYDSADRLVKSIKYIPRAGNITLAENTYDGLGRLATSKRNGNEAFTTTYRYNINGWLTDIQNPVFTENLFYEKSHNNSQAQYGGNISAVDWKVGGASDNGRTRGYTFRYDKMSRLIKADYFENGLASDHYSTAYGYDLMGNITSIKRNGLLDDDEFGLIDDLTLSYQGNQMVKVYDDAEGPVYKNAMHFADGTDKDVEYSYDANGNMIMDLNKNIESITYNSLGFPEHVKTSRIIRIESVRNENNIEYTYAADGRKLRVKYITTHPTVNREGKCLIPSFPVIKPSYYTFEYCGNWIFRDSTLHDILFDGGYISFERNTPHVHFYFRDHLGNVRVVTDRDGNIEQSNHYYPFGATFGESTNPNLQWFKYNGKELDTMYGLNLYDYSARAHDPLLGRFTTQDPLQEKCYGMNPYGYCVNNPVRYIDPDGERPKAYEAALMAAYVYGKDAEQYKERLLQTGWTISDFKPSIQMRYTRFYQNGLQSVLFQRTVEGVTEYAYVYAGTNSIEDAVEDFAQIAGVAFQYHTAIYNARILSDELKNSELTFVGHSLGGGEAIASSMATGRAAITFNPAAVSWLTKQIEGLNKVPNVVNYRAVGSKIGIGNIRLGGDMVNNFQEKLGLHLPGKTIGIPTGFIPTHTIYEFLKHKLPEP